MLKIVAGNVNYAAGSHELSPPIKNKAHFEDACKICALGIKLPYVSVTGNTQIYETAMELTNNSSVQGRLSLS